MRLILDLCRLMAGSCSEASYVVIQVLRIVNLIYNISQATLSLLVVMAIQGANTEPVAQEQFLIEIG